MCLSCVSYLLPPPQFHRFIAEEPQRGEAEAEGAVHEAAERNRAGDNSDRRRLLPAALLPQRDHLEDGRADRIR